MAQTKLELLLELKNRLKAGLSSAKNTVFTELKGMKAKLGEFTSANSKAFAGITDEVPGVGRALRLLANPYALAAAAALSFGLAAVKATSMALDWEHGMAKINVTAKLNNTELDKLSKKLLYMGSKGVTPIEQVPEAFNMIISAIGDVDQSLDLLPFVLKASTAGFADLKVVADSATGVMASSGESATVVFDTLFATLNKGKAEFADVAQYLPQVIPGAKNAGFALTETAGAFAFLTANGIKAMEASTGLKNVFKALSNPQITGKFKKMGIDIYDASGKARPLLEIVQGLTGAMAGLTDEQRVNKFSQLGLDMEAASTFSLMQQKADNLKIIMDAVIGGQGEFKEAIDNSKTSIHGWAGAWNKIKFIMIEAGQSSLPMIDAVGGALDRVLGKLIDFGIDIGAAFAGISNLGSEMMKVLRPIGEVIANMTNPSGMAAALAKLPEAFNQADIANAYTKGFKASRSAYSVGSTKGASTSWGDETKKKTTPEGDIVPDPSSGPSAQQSKSIVINIGTLYKADNKISTGNDGMSLTEFERKMNEVMLRTIRNVEASY